MNPNQLTYILIDGSIHNVMQCFRGQFALCTSVILFFMFIGLIHWLFYVPFNWIKHLDDVGFISLYGYNRYASCLQKKECINRIRKLRKIASHKVPPPYPNGWYAIIESSAVQKKHSISVSCLGENFVVYRTLKNKVYVLDSYCPHMGANLGVGGRVIGDNIECPFHRWSFRGMDGRCVNVPYSSCTPKNLKVRKWISLEVNEFIFIWYHADKNEAPWELPNLTELDSKRFVFSGRNEYYINCHIQEIPENGADLAHFTAIHKTNVLAGGDYQHFNLLANVGAHHWHAKWRPSDAIKHLAELTLKHSFEISNVHIFEMDVKGEQIGPSYVHLHLNSTLLGRIEVLQTVTPIEPLVQKVVHRFYAPRILSPIMKLIVIAESIMVERDILMWNHKMYHQNPFLVKEESAIKIFRNWYMQFYSENSKTFDEAHLNYEW